MGFGDYVAKVTIEHKLLRDYSFLKRFEGIRCLSAFIYVTLACKTPNGSPIPFFEKKGISSLEEYLELLNKNRWSAVRYYREAKKILERHFEYIPF